MTKKMSLNIRIALIALSVILPMIGLVGYLLTINNSSVKRFDEISKSATYANQYVGSFQESVDYTVYYAVIRAVHVENINKDPFFRDMGLENPYQYIEEMRQACDKMAELATVESNKTDPYRYKRSLDFLEKSIREIDENIGVSGKHDENLALIEKNIYSLTSIINNGLQSYVKAETENFAKVRDDIVRKGQNAIRISIITVIVTLSLSMLFSFLAVRSVTKPIKELSENAKLVAKGDFTTRTAVESKDEIAVLTHAFNDMTREIGELVEDIKVEQGNLRHTETKLLQAQINPHFLYNTLDTIVWLAEEKQTEEVVSMVTLLSNFFRTTLNKGKDYIPIEEEIIHVESYLKIQKFRYQDILDFEIQVEKEVRGETVPKLTLQPLVENALYHGIKNKRGKGKILVKGYRDGANIILQVIDNGQGMTAKKLEELTYDLRTKELSDRGGFGVKNVSQRIQYYYGKEYGVSYESTEGEGTVATILLPSKDIQPLS